MKLLLPQVLSILILEILMVVVVFLVNFLMVTVVVFRSVGVGFPLYHEAYLLPVTVLLSFMIVIYLDILHNILQI